MNKFLFLLLAIIFTSTAGAECYEDEDKFAGSKLQWCGAWGTNGKMLGGLWGIDPIPYKISANDGSTGYFIRLNYEGKDWLFIKSGESLIFLIDGKDKISLTTIDGSFRNRTTSVEEIGGATVHEFAFYPVTKEFLQKLAAATKVDFAVYGERGRAERNMGKSQLEYFDDFLKKYGE